MIFYCQVLVYCIYIRMQGQSNDSGKDNYQEQSPLKKIIKLKIFILVILSFAYLLYRIFLEIDSTVCIIDEYQNATEILNRALVMSQGSAFEGNSNGLSIGGKIFIGIGQVLMDAWIAFVGVVWFFKTKNMRSFFAMGIFYLVRSLVYLNIQKFPFPINMAWRSPGFFSFVVPYEHTRDFFFSGHTGGLLIVTCEAFKLGLRKIGILAFISLLYMMNMLVTTRVHYIIDVVGGLIFAIWSYRQSVRYVIFFDKLLSLPFFLFMKIKERFCTEKQASEMSQEIVPPSEKECPKQSQKQQIISYDISKTIQIEMQENFKDFQVLNEELNPQSL